FWKPMRAGVAKMVSFGTHSRYTGSIIRTMQAKPTLNVLHAITLIALIALAWSSFAYCGEIHDAAASGDLTKVKALLKADPGLVFSINKDGDTPLHLAALDGHKDVVMLLLASKADVNAKERNQYRLTPLHLAAFRGHTDVAALLL